MGLHSLFGHSVGRGSPTRPCPAHRLPPTVFCTRSPFYLGKPFSPRRRHQQPHRLRSYSSPSGGRGIQFPTPQPPMATKSQKKKKLSAANPSIEAKPPTPKQKPSPSKPVEEQETTTAAKKPKKQKVANEIDDIFQATKSDKKRKQQQEEGEEAEGGKKPKKSRAEGASKKSKKESGGKYRGPGDEEVEQKRPRRRTNDGLTIYSADELGFGKADAGGTALCPFDCDCCF